MHVLTPGWPVTKNSYWAVLLVLKATLIQLFWVALLGIHWYCFLTKWWAKYWLSLLARSRYSSTLNHESQNSSFPVKIILSSLLHTELWKCLKFERCRVRMTSLGASHAGLSRTCGSERLWRRRVALWMSCGEAGSWCQYFQWTSSVLWCGSLWGLKPQIRGAHIFLVICVIWFSVFQLNSFSKFKEKIWKVTQKEWCCCVLTEFLHYPSAFHPKSLIKRVRDKDIYTLIFTNIISSFSWHLSIPMLKFTLGSPMCGLWTSMIFLRLRRPWNQFWIKRWEMCLQFAISTWGCW